MTGGARLDGRRILVTGGGSGIGAATAEACVAAGARVGIIGRDPERLARMMERVGAVSAVADISDRAAAEAAVATIVDRLGGLDGLVNNAGVMLHSRISAGVAADWEQMLDVNVLGLLNVTHAALGPLRAAAYADVVNLSSVASERVAVPDFALYAATKAAVSRITEGLRADLADEPDIRVSVVKPGYVKTDGFGPGIRDPALREQVEATKREAGMEPTVVAEQICHLLAMPRTACVAELVLLPHRPR